MHAQPAVRERRVRRDELERRHVHGAERDGGIAGQRARMPLRRAASITLGMPTVWLTRTAAAFDETASAFAKVIVPT